MRPLSPPRHRLRSLGGRPLRIVALFVRYGETKYPGALDALLTYYERMLAPGDTVDVLVLDNQLTAPTDQSLTPPTPRRGEVRLVDGDNREWEWSAWNKGVARWAERIAAAELVHFVTDAFGNPPTQYLEDLDRPALVDAIERAYCIGSVDAYLRAQRVLDYRIDSWVRTSFYFFTPAALRKLGSMVSIGASESAAIFSDSPTAPFQPQAPLSPELQRIFLDWLTGPGQHGVQWHSRFALTAATLPLFQAKTLSLLNEILLSARLKQVGVPIVDATYLRYQRAVYRSFFSKAPPDLSMKPNDQAMLRDALGSGRQRFPAQPEREPLRWLRERVRYAMTRSRERLVQRYLLPRSPGQD